MYALLGRTHLEYDESVQKNILGSDADQKQFFDSLGRNPTLTQQERSGLKAIIMYIHALPISKKNIPLLLRHPIDLVRDIRIVVHDHKDDTIENATTGKPMLYWPGIKNDHNATHRRTNKGAGKKSASKDDISPIKKEVKTEPTVKQERVPCKVCQACIGSNCGKCPACAAMVQFGELVTLRKSCIMVSI